MKKCKGCGAILQKIDPEKEGFIRKEGDFCERCFRIKHYNEYQKLSKKNEDFLPILKQIDKTNDLVVLVLDLLNLPENLLLIQKHVHNPILLVLTKRDLLPRSIQDEYLIKFMDRYHLNVIDQILISSIKNINLDELIDNIRKYQTSKNVYVIGYTNAGKSTMINAILKHYSDLSLEITTSMLTSTTLDIIEVPCFKDLTLLDTPGLLEDGNIVDLVEVEVLKKILPKKEIKPITYQIKVPQTIMIQSICNIEINEMTNLTMYLSNGLIVDRVFKKIPNTYGDSRKIIINQKNTDVVILGLGFIRVMKPCTIILDINSQVKVYTRPSLIGK